VENHNGVFPADVQQLISLPGIGRSTAAAISAFAYGTRAAILDGNVKRVLTRAFGIQGWPNAPAVEKNLWLLAESLLPKQNIENYTQGLMDLGAIVCTRSSPQCGACPWQKKCVALSQNLTHELPQRKPVPNKGAITKRLREAHMLLLQYGDEVLLEKRPASGIWGGLWSVPEFDHEDSLKVHLNQLCSEWQIKTLPQRQHAFTHYTLKFTPHIVHLSKRPILAAEPGQIWLPCTEVAQAALPAPIKKLLLELPLLIPGQ
jgi:A/G-specific adenine glycosylase